MTNRQLTWAAFIFQIAALIFMAWCAWYDYSVDRRFSTALDLLLVPLWGLWAYRSAQDLFDWS